MSKVLRKSWHKPAVGERLWRAQCWWDTGTFVLRSPCVQTDVACVWTLALCPALGALWIQFAWLLSGLWVIINDNEPWRQNQRRAWVWVCAAPALGSSWTREQLLCSCPRDCCHGLELLDEPATNSNPISWSTAGLGTVSLHLWRKNCWGKQIRFFFRAPYCAS